MSSIVNQVIPWLPQGHGHGSPVAGAAGSPSLRARERGERPVSFDAVYRASFIEVARWVRALGANDADVEDVTQEVFIVVRRKLDSFDGRNLAGFLYRIAQRTVRDHRRSAWFRNLLRKQSTLPEIASPSPTGLQALQQSEQRRAVDAILARMSEKRRSTFVLFEIEGYSGEEIAQIQSIPLRTVWTRLHHARKDFVRMVSELPAREGER